MKKTVPKFSVLAAITIGCVCAGDTSVANSAVVRKALMSVRLDPAVLTARLEVKEITMAPGVKAGLHLHPCPVVGMITQSSVLFQIEGEEMQTLRTGDAFFEPANRRVTHFDNNGETPAVFTAFYLMSHEGQELIKILPR